MHKSLIESVFLSIILLPLIINYTNASEDDEELRSLLDQKVSSFSVNNQKMSETPNSIIILSKEDFYLFGYQTVSELINTIQGFYVRSDLNYDFIGSRGFDRTSSFSNNQVLLNGHVLNELVYGSQSLDNYLGIDMNDISKIEIVQGPASSLYGSGAMVSLINIKTKDGKEFNGLTAGYIKGTYGSDYGHLSFGKEYDDFSISLTARLGEKLGREFYFEEFKDSTSDGIAVGMDGERYHASTLQAKYKDFTLNAYYSFREKDIPNAPYSSDFNSPMTMSRDKRGFVSLAYNNELRNDILLRARAYFDYYEYFDVFTYDTEPMYDKNYGSWFGSELDMTWDISPGNRLLTGVNISNVNNLTYRLFDDYQDYFSNNIPYKSASVYVQNSSQITDDISVNAGIRADFLSYFSPNFNPRLALIINPTENSALKYLFNVGYRTPSIYELFADDESFKVVNVGLKPERLVSNELLFENRVNSTLIYTLSLFYNSFSQIIELSSVYPENADSLYVYKNIDGYRVYGAEVSLIAKPDDKIYFYTNCTYQKSRDSSGHNMTNSPELMLKAGFSYKLSKSIFFSFEGRYESGRDVSYYLRTEPHFLLDFNVGISPEFSGKGYLSFMNNLFLGLRVKNLLDKSYFMPGPNWVSTQFTEQYGRILSFIIRAKV